MLQVLWLDWSINPPANETLAAAFHKPDSSKKRKKTHSDDAGQNFDQLTFDLARMGGLR